MSLLISKNDVMELACKFKGHVAKEKTLQKLIETKESQNADCKRCGFGINVRMDPDDEQYYILSEL